jgi:hypothetical protein
MTPNVPFIGSGMNGNAMSSRFQTQMCCPTHVRNANVATVAQQGNLVDIDRQSGMHE